MEFTLVKGDLNRIGEYRDLFLDSKLYDAYFSEGTVLEDVLKQGVAEGNLYVAVNERSEAMGVMYMSMSGCAGLPYIHLLGVGKAYRGQGLGQAMVKIFIHVAEELGYPNMFIMVSKFNHRAKKLYESLGFQPQCLLRDLMRKGVSEWLLMRPADKKR